MKKNVANNTDAYPARLALAGASAPLPVIATWPNQYRGYEIRIECPEFTSVCPKTKLPDFGNLVLIYEPERSCIELKSFKYYLLGYRNMGVFYENAVNRILQDVVRATRPLWAELAGSFTARGGMRSTITARYGRRRNASKPRR